METPNNQPDLQQVPVKSPKSPVVPVLIACFVFVIVVVSALAMLFFSKPKMAKDPKDTLMIALYNTSRNIAETEILMPDMTRFRGVPNETQLSMEVTDSPGSFSYDSYTAVGTKLGFNGKTDIEGRKLLFELMYEDPSTNIGTNMLYITPEQIALKIPELNKNTITINTKTFFDDLAKEGYSGAYEDADLEKIINNFFDELGQKEGTDAKIEELNDQYKKAMIEYAVGLKDDMIVERAVTNDETFEFDIRIRQEDIEKYLDNISDLTEDYFYEAYKQSLEIDDNNEEVLISFMDSVEQITDSIRDISINNDIQIHIVASRDKNLRAERITISEARIGFPYRDYMSNVIGTDNYVYDIDINFKGEKLLISDMTMDFNIAEDVTGNETIRPISNEFESDKNEKDNSFKMTINHYMPLEENKAGSRIEIVTIIDDEYNDSKGTSFIDYSWDKSVKDAPNFYVKGGLKVENIDGSNSLSETNISVNLRGEIVETKDSVMLKDARISAINDAQESFTIDMSYEKKIINTQEISPDLTGAKDIFDTELYDDYSSEDYEVSAY